jgi:hypothetical protein
VWLREVLKSFEPEKPVIVFSHAPPMGCGLKVINRLHVKNRCAARESSVYESIGAVTGVPKAKYVTMLQHLERLRVRETRGLKHVCM